MQFQGARREWEHSLDAPPCRRATVGIRREPVLPHAGRASRDKLAPASLSTVGCPPGNNALTFFPSSQMLFYFFLVNEHPEVLLPISASLFIQFIQQVFVKGLLCAGRGKERRHSQLLGLGAEQQRGWWSTNTGSWMQEPRSLGERTGWREHSGELVGDHRHPEPAKRLAYHQHSRSEP